MQEGFCPAEKVFRAAKEKAGFFLLSQREMHVAENLFAAAKPADPFRILRRVKAISVPPLPLHPALPQGDPKPGKNYAGGPPREGCGGGEGPREGPRRGGRGGGRGEGEGGGREGSEPREHLGVRPLHGTQNRLSAARGRPKIVDSHPKTPKNTQEPSKSCPRATRISVRALQINFPLVLKNLDVAHKRAGAGLLNCPEVPGSDGMDSCKCPEPLGDTRAALWNCPEITKAQGQVWETALCL